MLVQKQTVLACLFSMEFMLEIFILDVLSCVKVMMIALILEGVTFRRIILFNMTAGDFF